MSYWTIQLEVLTSRKQTTTVYVLYDHIKQRKVLSLDAFSRAQSVTNAFDGRALPGPAGGA